VPGAGNPQAYNRYSYVLNNPLGYIDPSGHKPCRSDYLCGRREQKRDQREKAREAAAETPSLPDWRPNYFSGSYGTVGGGIGSGGSVYESGGGEGEAYKVLFDPAMDNGLTFSRKELIEMADKAERWQEFYTNTGTWIERGVGLGGSGVMLTIGGATCYPSFGLGCWMAGAATVEIMMMAHEVGRIGGYHQAENLGKINEYIEDLLIDDQRQQFTFHFKSDINHDLVLPGGTVLNSYEFYTISVDGYSETTSVDSRSAIIKIFGVEP
jgi:hypothetical protein